LAEADRAAEDAKRAEAGELRRLRIACGSIEEFVLFPREIAPRLHDAFVAIYRRAGFEPRLRNESFHTGWEIGILPEIPAVAIAPQTVAGRLPEGIAAAALSDPTDSLETCLVWRNDESSPRRRDLRGRRPLGSRARA
jgi:hypothetical protein